MLGLCQSGSPEWTNFTLKEKKITIVTGEVHYTFVIQLAAGQHSAGGVLVEESAA